MSAHQNSRQKGLRSSCDHCHQAKLRCVPTSTSQCQRCTNLKLHCIHSPPGRSGRVPNAEKSARRNKQAAASSTSVSITPRSSVDHEPCPSLSSGTTVDTNITIDPRDVMNDYTAAPDISTVTSLDCCDLDPLNGDALDMLFPTDATKLFTNFDGAAASSAPSSGFVMPMTGDISMTTPSPRQSNLDHNDQHDGDMSSVSSQCGCFQSILHAMEKLHEYQPQHMDLDVALASNKGVLIVICNSIKCVSSHDGTYRLMTLLLLRKTLHAYRELYRVVRQHLQDPHSHDKDAGHLPQSWLASTVLPNSVYTPPLADDRTYQPTAAVPITTRSPNYTRLSLGSYQIDHGDESSLARQILLLDLNKIPRLIERLDRRACGLDSTDGLHLYNMMRAAVLSEFKASGTEPTTLPPMPGLATPPESW